MTKRQIEGCLVPVALWLVCLALVVGFIAYIVRMVR